MGTILPEKFSEAECVTFDSAEAHYLGLGPDEPFGKAPLSNLTTAWQLAMQIPQAHQAQHLAGWVDMERGASLATTQHYASAETFARATTEFAQAFSIADGEEDYPAIARLLVTHTVLDSYRQLGSGERPTEENRTSLLQELGRVGSQLLEWQLYDLDFQLQTQTELQEVKDTIALTLALNMKRGDTRSPFPMLALPATWRQQQATRKGQVMRSKGTGNWDISILSGPNLDIGGKVRHTPAKAQYPADAGITIIDPAVALTGETRHDSNNNELRLLVDSQDGTLPPHHKNSVREIGRRARAAVGLNTILKG